MRFWLLEGSRVQNFHAEHRFDHFEDTWGYPTAWWRIECSQCHTDFVTWDTKRRYCSTECRTEAKHARTRARVADRARKAADAEAWVEITLT